MARPRKENDTGPEVEPAELDTPPVGTPETRQTSFEQTVKQNEEEHERMASAEG